MSKYDAADPIVHGDFVMFCFFSFTIVLLFQCEKWTDNPDQFVEEEDEDSFTYSVRISSQDLLLVSSKNVNLSYLMYRMTPHVGPNLPLTPKHKFRFSMRLMY